MTNKAGECAVKCLSQGYNRMERIGFEPRPCRLQYNPSTTQPTFMEYTCIFMEVAKKLFTVLFKSISTENRTKSESQAIQKLLKELQIAEG